MLPAFAMFFAFYLIASAVLRLLQQKTAGTPFGAALAWFKS